MLTTTLLFLPCTTFASIAWLPEETPSLRGNTYCITDEQYQKFEDAKNFYYKELLPDFPVAQEFPFFELTHSQTRQHIFMLGTHHDLPFECLPKWFQSFVKTQVEEIYLESKFCTWLATMGTNTDIQKHIEPSLQKEISDFLAPILNVFSKQGENLNLGKLYSIIMVYDFLFGLDATIEILSLKIKKPLFMLDKEMDLVNSNIFLHKEMLKQELSSPITSERQAHVESLLKSSDDELMSTYIKEEFKTLSQNISDKTQLSTQLSNWSKEPVVDDEPEDKEDSTNAAVLERNARWVELLNSTSPSKKLVAVGSGHLLDLFERFKKLGYEIKRYSPE